MVLLLSFQMPAFAADKDVQTLTVGHTTRLNGSFFSDMWGINTSDIDVRELLHGHPTIVWTVVDGETKTNKNVVSSFQSKTNKDGSKTFKLGIRRGLKYSDGSEINARDYVFSLLLQTSPLIKEIGGLPVSKDHIVGYDAYASGESNVFSGIRLINRHSFSVTVKKEYLPHYFELAFVHAIPYPIAVIAPGCSIADDGNGAYIKGDFNADILRKTILDPETGYLSHPSVTSGPYKLISYEPVEGIATFEINKYFGGNHEKVKPKIQRLVLREAKNETMIDELKSGKLQLVNKISSGKVITSLDELTADGKFAKQDYLRRGLAYLSFASEEGISASVKVRQAIAHMVDREALVKDFLHGYGEAVYGYYGIGQWMVQVNKDKLKELDIYPLDYEKAKALLIEDGWTFNEKGEAFKEGEDGLRYKKDGESLKPLAIKLLISRDNAAANITRDMLEKGVTAVGGKLEVESSEMHELLMRYYRQMDRNYDVAFLGTNFNFVFDPYYNFQINAEYQGSYNTSAVQNENLLQKALELRQTKPKDINTYLDRWMIFQKQWVELVPMIPLYSNIYHDAFVSNLVNYHPEFHSSWAAAILYARLK